MNTQYIPTDHTIQCQTALPRPDGRPVFVSCCVDTNQRYSGNQLQVHPHRYGLSDCTWLCALRTPPAPGSGWLVSLVLSVSLPFPRLERIRTSTSTSTSTCTCTRTYVSSYMHTSTRTYISYPDPLCSKLSDPPWGLDSDSLNWTAISFGFASGADLSLAGSGQWESESWTRAGF